METEEMETITTILFRKLKEYVHHVHNTVYVTPRIELLKDFMNMYTTVPDHDSPHFELVKGDPYYSGKKGKWFRTQWKKKELLIKTHTSFHINTVLHVFISYVILNQIELDQVTPTYGFFWIGQTSDGYLQADGEKRFCLVQPFRNGTRFSELKDTTFSQFKHYSIELVTTLGKLMTSSYLICHNDCVPHNILITPEEHIVMLDFSYASFSFINGDEMIRVTPNQVQEMYLNDSTIVSCVPDVIKWFQSCCDHPNHEITLFSFIQLQRIYQFFWKDIDTPIHITPQWLEKNQHALWVFDVLEWYESKLTGETKQKVHQHNITILTSLNPIWIVDFINM